MRAACSVYLFRNVTTLILNVNRYSSSFTGLDRPVGLQEVEASRIFGQSVHEGGKVVSCTHRPPLPRRGCPWYSFLLEAGSTPGPLYGWKGYVSRTRNLPACSAVPQPTAPPRDPFTTQLLKTILCNFIDCIRLAYYRIHWWAVVSTIMYH
jgi:hypothetical protein